MTFCSVRDLRNTKKEVWDNLEKQGNIIVTNNGKPKAILLSVSEDNFELNLKAIDQAKALIALRLLRENANKDGYMTNEEIEAEISNARKEKGLL